MSTKRTFLSPYQLGALSFLSKACNIRPFLDHLPRVDPHAVLCATMLQAGTEYFSVPQTLIREFPDADLLAGRIKPYDTNAYNDIHHLLNQTIVSDVTRREEGADSRVQDIDKLKFFLLDLLVAARRGESCVSVLPAPLEIVAAPELPPHLGITIACLLAEFVEERVDAPIPRITADRGPVQKFAEIIASDLFRSYASNHLALEDATHDSSRALEAISRSGRALEHAFKDRVDRSVVGLSFLTLTPKILDLAFGRLPGALAEFATQLLQPVFQERRRIVVHRFDGVADALLHQRLGALLRSFPPDEVIGAVENLDLD